MKKKPTISNSIKVIVTPWDKGFTCGILDEQNHMTENLMVRELDIKS